ncbi:YjgP/YjgQ family permease [Halanaerobium sp. ST460_2HS_T2]|jgi:LPS export ABC transporter permease LptG|uniref:YjgP/YjgQ family permease n=1 Tax=Halanaerobium sp. ST460_2HS_T2 TaxID=2183914 RepID=UPI000DF29245|nr:YjgP/YjgQ family permease [Halanaerobium sp. ST460_2HS_T2]RCW57343.1 LPS export ABC transporter permease LptF/LPS export ABC transporter permease LptG,TIGR04408 [Halanaerobium sp. ST460_2HS_T2]
MLKNKIKLIDKYIIKEVSYPFILGVLIVTVILIGNYFFQLTDLIIVKKVPVPLVLQLLAYKIPSVMVETFPIAVLFATMTGIGRLNRENEITAIRMGGVSIFRLIIPLLVIGITVSGLTLILNEDVVPWANHRANNIIRKTILKEAMPEPEAEVFFKGPQGRLFYVEKYDEKAGELHRVVIYELNQDQFPEVITAERGTIEENRWLLDSGIIHQYDKQGKIVLASKFEEMEIQLTDEMKELYGSQKSPSEMSREELGKRIALFKKSGINVDSLLVDYHLKLAEPLTALLFVLISVPLSLSGKESRTLNLIFTIVIVFLYYVILSFSRSFGKNYILPPLVAAWLPNLIFLFLGVILLFWRDSWQKIINKIFKILGISTAGFLLLFILNTDGQTADLRVKADYLNYDQNSGFIKIKGNIDGSYGQYYLKSEDIKIELADGSQTKLERTKNLELLPGEISGCDFEQPHYYFDAERVIIRPGEYIKMYNIMFRELNGKLPLLYWPYLYISLKQENSNFVPAFGYHQQRGWFIKTRYFYNNRFDLPGNFYLDHYTISGTAGGVKQYFINNSRQKAYLYYYSQQNKTDLSGLFNWEAELYHEANPGNWEEDFSYFYQDYDNKIEIDSALDFYYKKESRRSRINFDYEEQDYFEANNRDQRDYGFDFYFYDRFFDSLSTRLNYDREYFRDPEDGLEREINRELDLRYNPGEGWRSRLNYYNGERESPGESLKSREGGEFSISKRSGYYDFVFLMEQYAPRLTEADQVKFSRLPELSLEYNPPGPFSYLAQLGRYYEDFSGIEAYRLRGEAKYSDGFVLPLNSYLRVLQKFSSSGYQIEGREDNSIPGQQQSATELRLRTNLSRNLRLRNNYKYQQQWGYTPFNFDEGEKENQIENMLDYRILPYLYFNLESGYDFLDYQYLPLELYLNLNPTENWELKLGTRYDLNNMIFDDNLIFHSIYEGQRWEHRLGLEYDLNSSQLQKIDNQLIFNLEGDWGWYLESNLSFDYDYDSQISEANIQLNKKFHCRELKFSYDYLQEEITIQYSLELFPADPVGFTKTEDDLIFESSIEERLKNDDL